MDENERQDLKIRKKKASLKNLAASVRKQSAAFKSHFIEPFSKEENITEMVDDFKKHLKDSYPPLILEKANQTILDLQRDEKIDDPKNY